MLISFEFKPSKLRCHLQHQNKILTDLTNYKKKIQIKVKSKK